MSDLIVDLFRHNEWANLRLLEVCRALSDEQLDATAVGSFGTIRDTLQHYIGGEQRYVQRLNQTFDPEARGDPAFPGFDTLEASVRETSAALATLAKPTSGVHLPVDPYNGISWDAEVVIVQAINHSTEHRSQICTILTALGVTPPELDGWTWGEAEGRIRPA